MNRSFFISYGFCVGFLLFILTLFFNLHNYHHGVTIEQEMYFNPHVTPDQTIPCFCVLLLCSPQVVSAESPIVLMYRKNIFLLSQYSFTETCMNYFILYCVRFA